MTPSSLVTNELREGYLDRIRGVLEHTTSERELDTVLVESLQAEGLFNLWLPEELGGLELDFPTTSALFRDLAYLDASTAWCVMVANCSLVPAGLVSEAAARTIHARPDVIVGGSVNPTEGAATLEANGTGHAVLDGRWGFVSGSTHCDWFVLAAVGSDQTIRFLYVPSSDATVEDTWDAGGLQRTASNHVRVDSVVVPAGFQIDAGGLEPWVSGALYRMPPTHLLACSLAPIAVGIANRAVDELVLLATEKVPLGASRTLANRPITQAELGRHQGALRAAEDHLHHEFLASWDSTSVSHTTPPDQRARARLAAINAIAAAVAAVDFAYSAGGGTSVYSSSPLQACFRDIHALTQHNGASASNFQVAGRILFGIETDMSRL